MFPKLWFYFSLYDRRSPRKNFVDYNAPSLVSSDNSSALSRRSRRRGPRIQFLLATMMQKILLPSNFLLHDKMFCRCHPSWLTHLDNTRPSVRKPSGNYSHLRIHVFSCFHTTYFWPFILYTKVDFVFVLWFSLCSEFTDIIGVTFVRYTLHIADEKLLEV